MSFSKLDKAIYDNPLSKKPNFIAVWSFLTYRTTYKNEQITIYGIPLHIPSGIYHGTVREIEQGTGVPRSTVHRILKKMEASDMLEYSVITSYIIHHEKWDKNPEKNKMGQESKWDNTKLHDTLVKSGTRNFRIIKVNIEFGNKKISENGARTKLDPSNRLEKMGQDLKNTALNEGKELDLLSYSKNNKSFNKEEILTTCVHACGSQFFLNKTCKNSNSDLESTPRETKIYYSTHRFIQETPDTDPQDGKVKVSDAFDQFFDSLPPKEFEIPENEAAII